jgi:hypothetical protein
VSPNHRITLATVLAHPWGAPPHGIDAGYVAAPQTGHLVAYSSDTQVRAEPRLFLHPERGLCVLCDDIVMSARGYALLYRFDTGRQDGTVLRIGRPSPAGQWHIDDVLLLAVGAVLAECIEGQNLLRCVDEEGRTTWERYGPRTKDRLDAEQLAGTWDALFRDGAGHVYVAASAPQGAISCVDLATGAVRPYGTGRGWSGRAFMDPAGCLYSVRYDPAARKRLWVRIDLHSGIEEAATAEDASYPFLAETIGVDTDGRAYGVAWPEIACIDRSGALAWRLGLDAIGLPGRAQWLRTWSVVPDGTVLIPVQTAMQFVVSALVVR